MEKLITLPHSEEEKYLEIAQMLRFVRDSRESHPDLAVINDRKKYLQKKYTSEAGTRLMIDEFVIRFLFKSKDGVGTFDLFDFVHIGAPEGIDRLIFQREVWDLVDSNVLVVGRDRRMKLSSEVSKQFANKI